MAGIHGYLARCRNIRQPIYKMLPGRTQDGALDRNDKDVASLNADYVTEFVIVFGHCVGKQVFHIRIIVPLHNGR
jgi:hypothetical protein